MSDLNQNCIHFMFELHLFNTILRACLYESRYTQVPESPSILGIQTTFDGKIFS